MNSRFRSRIEEREQLGARDELVFVLTHFHSLKEKKRRKISDDEQAKLIISFFSPLMIEKSKKHICSWLGWTSIGVFI